MTEPSAVSAIRSRLAADSDIQLHKRWSPRILTGAAAAVVVLVVGILAYTVIAGGTLHWDVVLQYFFSGEVIKGVGVTLLLTGVSLVGSAILGSVLATMRVSHNVVLKVIASAYVWFFRGTPVLVQVVFWFNLALFLPRIAGWDTNQLITPMTAALLALLLNVSAFMCEVIRGGLLSVDPGQVEAALSIGMTPRQSLLRIVMPQAIRVILPAAGNLAIDLLKATSLVYVIGTRELLGTVQSISSQTFYVIEMLIVASLWYLLLVSVASFLQARLEAHFGRGAGRQALSRRERLRRRAIAHTEEKVI
ncbi:amino acid ABC transporter permease [Nakamurella endophytica]|uniref:ABC transporter permease n=1 Tax=Nakamurella endophytica TaxID=1748367 RepID=A0A917WMK1_9ACTN|nr:amino acid ABC transporter permease [Nakamurella endophytica]GGM14511.1 ABC transporter permease [Nakamurella endophytica]